MITVNQINTNRSFTATTLLMDKLRKKDDYVLLISEPNLSKSSKINGITGNARAFPAKGKEKQRTCVVVHKSLECVELSKFTTKDCVAVMISLANSHVVFVSFYCDIKGLISEHEVKKVIEFANKQCLPIILGGDTNAHSILFGNEQNRRGEHLEDLIMGENLRIENIGRLPTFETIREKRLLSSCIDITLSKNLKQLAIKNWLVNRSYNASDHNTIEFKLEGVVAEETWQRNWNKIDWKIFKEKLSALNFYVPERMTKKKLDNMVRIFYKKSKCNAR